MADRPIPDLDGRTPMQTARTPNWDRLAASGEVGKVRTVPEGVQPTTEAANMALMGLDPRRYPTAGGPLEAAALGVPLEPRDLAFRCSLIATDAERILDHSAGNIPDAQARPLVELAATKLSTGKLRIHPGSGHRHVLVWAGGPLDLYCKPPHAHVGEPYRALMPQGDGDQVLRTLIDDSLNLLHDHPINRERIEEGLMPANMLWPWGQSRAPELPRFALLWGLPGALVAASDIVRGLGALQGMTVPNVAGATGYINTDYEGKAQAALDLLESHDFVYLHVKAPDEAGRRRDPVEKVRAIERIDDLLVGRLLDGLKGRAFRLLIVPDHATPADAGAHVAGPVPYLLHDSHAHDRNSIPFDERALEEQVPNVPEGHRLLERLLLP
jgi:2,3-bisphosphoglycerate-independent phosphoglycerate mutase